MKYTYILDNQRAVDYDNLYSIKKSRPLGYDFSVLFDEFLKEIGFTLTLTCVWELKGICINLQNDAVIISYKNKTEKIHFGSQEWGRYLFMGFVVDTTVESMICDPVTYELDCKTVKNQVTIEGFLTQVLRSIRKIW